MGTTPNLDSIKEECLEVEKPDNDIDYDFTGPKDVKSPYFNETTSPEPLVPAQLDKKSRLGS